MLRLQIRSAAGSELVNGSPLDTRRRLTIRYEVHRAERPIEGASDRTADTQTESIHCA